MALLVGIPLVVLAGGAVAGVLWCVGAVMDVLAGLCGGWTHTEGAERIVWGLMGLLVLGVFGATAYLLGLIGLHVAGSR